MITIMRASRPAKKRCDKFTAWESEDGSVVQGFLHDTGIEVFYAGEWVPQYRYPDGSVWPTIKVSE